MPNNKYIKTIKIGRIIIDLIRAAAIELKIIDELKLYLVNDIFLKIIIWEP